VTRIDAHAHLIPDDYRAALERHGVMPAYGLPPWSRAGTIAFLDDHEIGAAVMSLSPPGVSFGDRALAARRARAANEATADLVRSDPARFAGLAVLPVPDLDDCLEELAYALDVLMLDGVALMTNVNGLYLGDERLEPLMAELDRRGTYVLLHPTDPPHERPLAYPPWLLEFPFDTTRAIAELIYSGTLERHRSVRIQVCHLGGAAPFLAHRIASLSAREPALAALAPDGALGYLSRLWYDTAQADNDIALDGVRGVAPLERVVFGSDWPYAAIPRRGDPAPGLATLGDRRAAVDGEHVLALVPRLAAVLAG
jgi:predicted TIM-barrel fold metal-dependent hydrolase